MIVLEFFKSVLEESYTLLLDASVYILFGILISGVLKVFLSPNYIANHLGRGRFLSVFKAALLGVPLPLCSCGVLPAAASLKKQGANNGATMAFLVSTPESGVDSICITYAMLDPIMTVVRPVAAFVSAFIAGVTENFWNPPTSERRYPIDVLSPNESLSNCGCGGDCSSSGVLPSTVFQGGAREKTNEKIVVSAIKPAEYKEFTIFDKLAGGLRYAVDDLWADIAGWFLLGVLIAGLITVLIPDDVIFNYLGGGLQSMLLMLLVGIPLYICATASTPIAAALILKGVSPGAALVFLLVGPATNVTSLSVLLGILGKRATILYLGSIAVVSVMFGLMVDQIYSSLGISVSAVVGQGAEIIPPSIKLFGAVVVLLLSIKPMIKIIENLFRKEKNKDYCCSSDGCGS